MLSTSRAHSGSTIFWARRRLRISWFCVLPIRSSSIFGTSATSTMCRSPPASSSALRIARVITRALEHLRDMVQNHLMQLLCLIAMEPPTDLSADSIRDEKVKVLRSLRRMQSGGSGPERVSGASTRRVRSTASRWSVTGKRKTSKPESMTETYVALRILIDNWRWADVPFYMRVGKRLPKGGTEIGIHFKNAPGVLFNRDQNGGAGRFSKCSGDPDSAGRGRLVADAIESSGGQRPDSARKNGF